MSTNNAVEEVRQASQKWITTFNQGDVESCVAIYSLDATMEARPMGTYQGREAIKDFWLPFIKGGAGELIYSNIHLRLVNPSLVILSADWSMNVGKGIVTCERWIKNHQQNWQLEEDRFEILEQY